MHGDAARRRRPDKRQDRRGKPPRDGAGRSWRGSVDRVVLTGLAFVVGAHAVGTSAAMALSGPRLLASGGPAWVLLLGSQVGLVVLALGRRAHGPDSRATAAASGLAVAGLLAASWLGTDPLLAPFATQLLPVNALQVVMLVPVALAVRGATTVLTAAVAGGVHVVLRWQTVGLTALEGVDEWVLPAGMALSIWAVVGHLRTAAGSADEALGRGRRDTAERSDRANAELALEATRRVVHDDVITALSGVELGLRSDELRRACRAALVALTDADGVEDLDQLEDRLRAGSTLQLDVDHSGWRATPPPRVLSAVRGAVGEALRNAARHGDALSARIVLTSSTARASVVVTDDGTGLDDDWRPGFGITRSIRGRMADVGGSAYVGPSPSGTGAQVRLVWPEAGGMDPLSGRRSLWDYGRAVRTIAVIPAITNSYLFLRFPGRPALLGLLVLLALGLVLLAVVRRTTAREPFDAWRLVLLGVAVCGLTWIGLVAAGPQSLFSVQSWVVGAGANVLCIVAFQVSPAASVAMASAQVATVVSFAAAAPGLAPTDPAGALLTPITVVGVGMIFGAGVRRSERRMAAVVATTTRDREQSAWSRSFAHSRRLRLAHLGEEVVPFLEGIATGDVAPDPERARVLAARCRDDLYLTRPLDRSTRRAVDRARAHGARIAIRAGDEGADDFPDEVWTVLRDVLDHVGAEHRVTVLPPTPQEVARIAVVPPLDPAAVGRPAQRDPLRSTFPVAASPDRTTSPT